MNRVHKDSKGFYRTLGVSPAASDDEIRLACALLKSSEDARAQAGVNLHDVTRAFDFLKNPQRRRAYDKAETSSSFSLGIDIELGDPRLLAACLAVLLAILGFVWIPLYGSRFRSFSAGDRLVDARGNEVGVVVQSDERHMFPEGVRAPAYLVQAPGSDQLRWYPARDLQGTCRRAD